MKTKYINFRATEKEILDLETLAKKSKLTKSDFIRHAIFNKEIVVIDGLNEVTKELKRIGNNLNQITTRANMGHFNVVYLDETKENLADIYDKLSEICDKKYAEEKPSFKMTPELLARFKITGE